MLKITIYQFNFDDIIEKFMKPVVGITPRTLISKEIDSLTWKFLLDKPV